MDVNPYIRFLKIFEPLLSPDDMGYEEFNQALSDILPHYLADLDLKSGMCKQDFYTSFIVKDLESGAYGGLDELKEFTRMEKVETARWLLCFYKTGDNESCISGAAGCLLPECEVLVREGTEFVFYMREPWNETDNKKLMFLVRLFLPLSAPYTVHWTHTYGVTGYNETMRLGSFVLA